MRKFNSADYFKLCNEGDRTVPVLYIKQPTSAGLELISQYLNYKYQANICHPIIYCTGAEMGMFRLNAADKGKPDYLRPKIKYLGLRTAQDINYIKYITPYIREAQKMQGDYRQAFIIFHKGHATFMAYIKEGAKEALLYSDTVNNHPKYIPELQKVTGVKVYATVDARQADHWSCHTDGLVMGRDITGINPQTNQYFIPNILERLEKRAIQRSGYFLAYLPDELLKTAQIPAFVSLNKELSDEVVHKNETLDEFRKRYSSRLTLINRKTAERKEKDISVYLQKKGDKYSEIMQIQFYLNEIEDELGALLSVQKDAFIVKAKEMLRNGENSLHDFSEQFLKELSINTQTVNDNTQETSDKNIKDVDPTELRVQLTQKYALNNHELDAAIDEIKEKISTMPPAENALHWKKDGGERLLVGLVKHKLPSLALALTEYLLHYSYEHASPSFWQHLAKINLKCAHLILDNELLINHFYRNKELCYFAYGDTYLSKMVLIRYPKLLDRQEKEVLNWVSRFDEEKRSKSNLSFEHYLIEEEQSIIQAIKSIKIDLRDLNSERPEHELLKQINKILKLNDYSHIQSPNLEKNHPEIWQAIKEKHEEVNVLEQRLQGISPKLERYGLFTVTDDRIVCKSRQCEERSDEATQELAARSPGLLHFVRNDGFLF
ncbi:MAG: hypothetical protein P4L79_06050 [Legionella sp.]|uniref:hypothetical protein n=1 Tax=Legionella sp. TaxID=459 RepID=UPI00284A100D|nr:hypothetical protein [Legionella sp.]